MQHIWSPWRYGYIASAGKLEGCIFCILAAGSDDSKNLIVHRGSLSFVILNLYPYTTGHLMVVPYKHTGSLTDLDPATTTEVMEFAKKAEIAIDEEYKPDGYNIGLNLGSAAGAGVAGHVHLHVVPRWAGDANFVSVIGETRVLPEALSTTYDRLRKRFDAQVTI